MNRLPGAEWIYRHRVTVAFLLLAMFCVAAHSLAMMSIALLRDIPFPPEAWPSHWYRNRLGIQFFDANWRFALPYLGFCLSTLASMETRSLPRWSIWSATAFLGLPMLGYLQACLRVGTSTLVVMGPTLGP